MAIKIQGTTVIDDSRNATVQSVTFPDNSVQTTASSGQLLGSAAVKAIAYNSQTISENITISAGLNGLSAGPITIGTGFTVTISSGANWVIV